MWSALDRTAEQQIVQRCKLSGTRPCCCRTHIFSTFLALRSVQMWLPHRLNTPSSRSLLGDTPSSPSCLRYSVTNMKFLRLMQASPDFHICILLHIILKTGIKQIYIFQIWGNQSAAEWELCWRTYWGAPVDTCRHANTQNDAHNNSLWSRPARDNLKIICHCVPQGLKTSSQRKLLTVRGVTVPRFLGSDARPRPLEWGCKTTNMRQ